MWRDIILSAAGHALVLGTVVLPSFLSTKTFTPVTFVTVKMVPSQSISQLLERTAETGKPKPKVPQVNVKPEKLLPNPEKNSKKVQPVKRAAIEEEKITPPGTAEVTKKDQNLPQDITTEQKDFNDNEYLIALMQKIKSNWHYPSLNAPNIKTVVYFRIDRNGQVSRVKVDELSGFMNFDSSAYEAVVKSAPFPPLPESYSGNQLGIFLKFSY